MCFDAAYFKTTFCTYTKNDFIIHIGPDNGSAGGLSSLRAGWANDLNTLHQWREMDQNGFISSHVGNATNICGVSSASRGGGNEHNEKIEEEEDNDGDQKVLAAKVGTKKSEWLLIATKIQAGDDEGRSEWQPILVDNNHQFHNITLYNFGFGIPMRHLSFRLVFSIIIKI